MVRMNILKQKKTYYYFSIGLVISIIGFLLGIDDNVPGIIITTVGLVIIVLGFTHNFKTVKSYLILFISSIGLLFISGALHNILHTIGKGTFLEVIRIIFFLIALLLAPAGMLAGVVGMIIKISARDKSVII